jgi:hypothetical protein
VGGNRIIWSKQIFGKGPFGRALTDSFKVSVRSENRTHDLRDESYIYYLPLQLRRQNPNNIENSLGRELKLAKVIHTVTPFHISQTIFFYLFIFFLLLLFFLFFFI